MPSFTEAIDWTPGSGCAPSRMPKRTSETATIPRALSPIRIFVPSLLNANVSGETCGAIRVVGSVGAPEAGQSRMRTESSPT